MTTALPTPSHAGEASGSPKEAPVQLARSDDFVSRDTFEKILSLTAAQPWLKEAQPALIELIGECEDGEEQKLLYGLLHKFLFLDLRAFEEAAQSIATHIEDIGLGPANTTICAIDDSTYSDSSQMLAYKMKTVKWTSGEWETTNFVGRRCALSKAPLRENVVFVDEFVGTGGTAARLLKKAKVELAEMGSEANVFFAAIAGMEASFPRVKAQVENVFYVHQLSRGISDDPDALTHQPGLAAMKRIESRLAQHSVRGLLSKYSLGYKRSEALFARAGGNAPNNVFPVFWWDKRLDLSTRSPLLRRI